MNVFLCSSEWFSVLISWCIGLLLGLLARKVFKMDGFEWPSYESKDELYNDSPGSFLGELLGHIEKGKKKIAFTVELTPVKHT